MSQGSVDSHGAIRSVRSRAASAAALGTIAIAFVVLVPSTSGRGSEMDEGAVVAYAARVLDGAIPHRDFLTFYGPANPWVVAGAFKVFGTSVATERMVGLLYRIVIVLSLFILANRLGGMLAGSLAGIVSAKFMAHDLVWAYATYGAIAFGLLGLALATSGATRGPRRLLWLGAGVAAGVAMLMRFDIGPAILVSVVPLLLFVPARSRIAYGVGLFAMTVIYAAHIAVVGPAKVERVIRDLIATGPGRSLPLPQPWLYPGSLLAVALIVTVLLVVVGGVIWWRRPSNLDGRLLVSVGLLSAGVLPWTLFRPDAFHVRGYALVPLCLLPAVALYLVRSARVSPRARTALALVIAGISLLPVISDGRSILGHARELRGIRIANRGFYDAESAASAAAVIARVGQLARSGDSLFVGPRDLRRTNYGPTYMYFLLPQLRPASYYMEMNPMTANREGSGLADELRRADWLILTSRWDTWDEPNQSTKFGPSEPNEVVRKLFCVRQEAGAYRLLERCDRAGDPPG